MSHTTRSTQRPTAAAAGIQHGARRMATVVVALVALVMSTVACSVAGGGGSDDRKGTLRVASFGGALQDTLQELYRPFEEKFDVTIEWVAGTATENVAKAQATQNQPEFDIIFTEDTNQYAASSKGLLEQLDPNIVTHLKDLAPIARGANNDGVATGMNPTALYYNTAEFKKNGWAPPKTWEDLKRPEFCGKIGLTDPNVTYTLHLAQMLGGGETKDIEAGLKELEGLSKCVKVFEKSSSALEQKLQLGQVLVGAYGTTRLGPLSNSYPIAAVYPDKGMIGLSMISVVKNAPNAEMAQEFINWVLRPETQEQLVSRLDYYPSNVTVKSVPEFPGVATLEQLADWQKADAKVINSNRSKWAEAFIKAIA